MAVAGRGVSSGTTTGVSFGTITKPTGTVDGDLIFAFVAGDGTSSGGTPLSPPDGTWSQLWTPMHPTADGQFLHGWYKVHNGDGASWSWGGSFSSGNDVTWCARSYSGQAGTWQDGMSTLVDSNVNSSPVTTGITGITTTTDGNMLLWVCAGDPNTANSGSWTVPGGYNSVLASYTNFAPLCLADVIQSSHGATGVVNGVLTFASGGAGFCGTLIGISASGGGGPPGVQVWETYRPPNVHVRR